MSHLGDVVVKVGPPGPVGSRVDAQSRWLCDYARPCLPRVLARWPGGYVMEALKPVDWSAVDWEVIVDRVVASLERLWTVHRGYHFRVYEHLEAMKPRCELLPGSYEPMVRWALSLDWRPVHDFCGPGLGAVTHGDPTLDNVMHRGATLVLTDPNPSAVPWPAHPVGDLAHLAQSLHGYEHLKRGAPVPTCGPDILDRYVGEEERPLLRYLTAAKFVRLLHYEQALRPVFAEVAWRLIEEGAP